MFCQVIFVSKGFFWCTPESCSRGPAILHGYRRPRNPEDVYGRPEIPKRNNTPKKSWKMRKSWVDIPEGVRKTRNSWWCMEDHKIQREIMMWYGRPENPKRIWNARKSWVGMEDQKILSGYGRPDNLNGICPSLWSPQNPQRVCKTRKS